MAEIRHTQESRMKSSKERPADVSEGYKYEDLPSPRSIRLLCLEPSSGVDELRAYFQLATIDEPPAYEALSYTWGESIFSETLNIGNKTVNITKNLARALLYYQLDRGPRLLWIDAVCINQENFQEKGQQVGLMGNIYSKASRVLIWLGEPSPEPAPAASLPSSVPDANGLGLELDAEAAGPTITYKDGKRLIAWPGQRFRTADGSPSADWGYLDPNAELVILTLENGKTAAINLGKRPHSPPPSDAVPLDGFALVKRVGFEHLVPQDNMDFYRAVLRETELVRDISIFSDPVVEKILRLGIDQVYTNPWFTRMWIVQEVCLASEAVICHRGKEMDWTDFSIAMALLEAVVRLRSLPMSMPSSFARAYGLVRTSALFKMSTSVPNTEQRLRAISRLSHNLRGQKCKFDQDRIFALLSLQPEGSPLSLAPDYTQPVMRIFRDFAGISLTIGMIETLYDAGAWERDDVQSSGILEISAESLPSWAPDFRHESKNPQLPWLKQYFRHQLASSLDSTARGPSLSPLSCYDFKLEVEVLMIDYISTSSYRKFPSRNFIAPGESKVCFDAVREHVQLCQKAYNEKTNGRSIPNLDVEPETAFWATMVSYSSYSRTPIVFPGLTISLEGVRDLADIFQKHCLDEGGLLSDGRASLSVDGHRDSLMERMGPEGSTERSECYMALKFYDIVRETLDGVQFVVTEVGYAGLAPPTPLLQDDLVVMVKGAQIPFIVRRLPIRDSYILVGSCYVFGLMDNNITGEYSPIQLF
jgi:hypothetical protein